MNEARRVDVVVQHQAFRRALSYLAGMAADASAVWSAFIR